MIITGAYVGYHAWEASLHEEPEKHSESIEIGKHQTEFPLVPLQAKVNQIWLIG